LHHFFFSLFGEVQVALFFLAAGLVFILARWFGLRTKREGGVASLVPCFWAATVVGGLSLFWALLAAWINAREAHSKDAIVAAIKALSSLGNHQSVELIGGALAGIILHEGFRRTQEMSASSEGALKNSAIVVLPAVLFLAVALSSREGVLERITGLEAGGVKVTMQPMGGAGGADGIGQSRSAVAGGSGVIHDPFPNLRLLSDLINDDERKDLIARDRKIILTLSGRDRIDPEVEHVVEAQRYFLRLFGRSLACLKEYVRLSNDSRLMAIAGVDIPLGLVVLERTLGQNRGFLNHQDKSHAKRLLRETLSQNERLRWRMNSYVQVGSPNPDNSRCRDDHYDQIELAQISEVLEELWTQQRRAPYVTLAAAWLGSAYKDPGLAANLLITWLADNPPSSTATPDVALAWFRVRTLIQLVNIMPSASGGREPAAARHALDATWREFEALPGLPSLERYARSIVKGKADDCPKIGSIVNPVDANLYNTRIFVLARRLHAVVDNPDPTNRLNADHMRLAHALKDADPVCISESLRTPTDMRALGAIHQIVFSRVAFAWASDPAVSREQAEDLRKQGREAVRKGLNELEALYAEWRHKPLDENGRQVTDLEKHLQRGFDYFPDLERARWLAQEFLR
jgi:hypothetical protein